MYLESGRNRDLNPVTPVTLVAVFEELGVGFGDLKDRGLERVSPGWEQESIACEGTYKFHPARGIARNMTGKMSQKPVMQGL